MSIVTKIIPFGNLGTNYTKACLRYFKTENHVYSHCKAHNTMNCQQCTNRLFEYFDALEEPTERYKAIAQKTARDGNYASKHIDRILNSLSIYDPAEIVGTVKICAGQNIAPRDLNITLEQLYKIQAVFLGVEYSV